MVQSAAMNAVDANKYPRTLNPNEVRQVLMNTASPVVPQIDHPTVPKQWPGNPDSKTDDFHSNWSTQYGYGRVNIGKATKLIMDGRVPPEALITSPGWYKYVDPAKDKTLQVKGHVKPSAWGSQGVDWVLEWALGANPKDTDFHTVSTGNAGKSGVLGTIDTSDIPASYAAKNPANTLPPDGPEQYTVSIRLRAKDGNGLKGEDRRSFGARTDPGMVDGFPKSIGTEISAAPAFVDLNGTHKQELVFGTNDGVVSALEPDGQQAAGFPVMTRQLRYIDENNLTTRSRACVKREIRSVASRSVTSPATASSRSSPPRPAAGSTPGTASESCETVSRSSRWRSTTRFRCRRRSARRPACRPAATGLRRPSVTSRETAHSTF